VRWTSTRPGFVSSLGLEIAGGLQVGYGTIGSGAEAHDHALLWSGTAASAVDLQSFLSSDYSDSHARDIDSDGNIVGFANYSPTNQIHAILWVVVPEPGTGLLLIVGLLGLAGWRRASGLQLGRHDVAAS
jgi:hypothetical protein